jgi:hypothetical protein
MNNPNFKTNYKIIMGQRVDVFEDDKNFIPIKCSICDKIKKSTYVDPYEIMCEDGFTYTNNQNCKMTIKKSAGVYISELY